MCWVKRLTSLVLFAMLAVVARRRRPADAAVVASTVEQTADAPNTPTWGEIVAFAQRSGTTPTTVGRELARWASAILGPPLVLIPAFGAAIIWARYEAAVGEGGLAIDLASPAQLLRVGLADGVESLLLLGFAVATLASVARLLANARKEGRRLHRVERVVRRLWPHAFLLHVVLPLALIGVAVVMSWAGADVDVVALVIFVSMVLALTGAGRVLSNAFAAAIDSPRPGRRLLGALVALLVFAGAMATATTWTMAALLAEGVVVVVGAFAVSLLRRPPLEALRPALVAAVSVVLCLVVAMFSVARAADTPWPIPLVELDLSDERQSVTGLLVGDDGSRIVIWDVKRRAIRRFPSDGVVEWQFIDPNHGREADSRPLLERLRAWGTDPQMVVPRD
jgi:hypothetical protein